MKSLILSIAIVTLAFTAGAQEYETEGMTEGTTEEVAPVDETAGMDCFQKYSKLFEDRGSEEVADGTYEDIVIVVDKGGVRECFSGKATVYNQKMACTTVQFATDNGFREGPKTRSLPVNIKNGMATAYQAEDGMVTIIFPKAMKPKKDNIIKAPEPDMN